MPDAVAAQMPLFTAILAGLSAFAFWIGVTRREQPGDILARLDSPADRRRVPEELELAQPFIQRVVMPSIRRLIRRLGRLMPQRNIEQLQHDLDTAGRPLGFTVSDFLGLRLMAAVLAAGGVIVLLGTAGLPVMSRLLFATGAGIVGSLLPRFWIKRRIQARQSAIQRALPDALDMLTIAVTAGLGFDASMQQISEKWDNALSDEFWQVIREIQVGIPRTEALRNLARRAGVTEVSHFVAVVVQADQLGLSIKNVLKAQSAQMRVFRRQRAEELARQAPLKMLFPLIFLIFPAMFVVILGPAVPILVDAFSNM